MRSRRSRCSPRTCRSRPAPSTPPYSARSWAGSIWRSPCSSACRASCCGTLGPVRPNRSPRPDIGRYFRHRIVRIWPAYIVVVVLVLTLLPDAKGADLTVWLANLTLTQVFVSLSLTAGLTQMWSLSVEVAFYLLLPLIGLALVRLRGDLARLRIPAILAMGVVSLGWAWFADTLPLSDGIETKNWVFGHLPWFAAGLVLAEISASTEAAHHDRQSYPRWLRITVDFSANRRLMGAVFVVAYGLACTPLAGPTGLGEVTDLQFATKMVLGAIVAYALLAPLVCAQGPFRFLDSPVMQALGRWSYGIFIWHLAVLAIVFPCSASSLQRQHAPGPADHRHPDDRHLGRKLHLHRRPHPPLAQRA